MSFIYHQTRIFHKQWVGNAFIEKSVISHIDYSSLGTSAFGGA